LGLFDSSPKVRFLLMFPSFLHPIPASHPGFVGFLRFLNHFLLTLNLLPTCGLLTTSRPSLSQRFLSRSSTLAWETPFFSRLRYRFWQPLDRSYLLTFPWTSLWSPTPLPFMSLEPPSVFFVVQCYAIMGLLPLCVFFFGSFPDRLGALRQGFPS